MACVSVCRCDPRCNGDRCLSGRTACDRHRCASDRVASVSCDRAQYEPDDLDRPLEVQRRLPKRAAESLDSEQSRVPFESKWFSPLSVKIGPSNGPLGPQRLFTECAKPKRAAPGAV